MTKSLMISKQPKQVLNFLNGNATLELRTWIPKDYVGWVYVYITKGKPYLVNFYNELPCYAINGYTYKEILDDGNTPLNGKVAFRFWFDEYIELEHYDFWGESYYWKNTVLSAFELEKATCVSSLEMEEYAKGKTLYAWHIKQLEIFDEPKSLSDFYVEREEVLYPLTKPPKRSVWVYGN